MVFLVILYDLILTRPSTGMEKTDTNIFSEKKIHIPPVGVFASHSQVVANEFLSHSQSRIFHYHEMFRSWSTVTEMASV